MLFFFFYFWLHLVNRKRNNLGFFGQQQSKPQKLKMGTNPEEKLEYFSSRETSVYQCSNQTQRSGLNLDLWFILCDV